MEDCAGVITVDSDGQHTVEDVVALQNELNRQTAPALLLGMRDFDDLNAPFKSRYGNKITPGHSNHRQVVHAIFYIHGKSVFLWYL
mgnify:CR=1 FL=1